MIKTYSELIQLPTFQERFEYLKLDGVIADETFGFDRYLNQQFYKSQKWKHLRNEIIIRDNGCDLGDERFPIYGRIIIHHINPVSQKDILSNSEYLLSPEFLICTSFETHNAIHYGDPSLIPHEDLTVRTPNDTCPWR